MQNEIVYYLTLIIIAITTLLVVNKVQCKVSEIKEIKRIKGKNINEGF